MRLFSRVEFTELRQSILAKAFSGELVETEAEIARREGRDYETAKVLIERVKKERGKVGKKENDRSSQEFHIHNHLIH